MTEPLSTALLLAGIGVLLGLSVLSSRASGRMGIPYALAFLALGMLAGSEGVGGVHFEDYELAFRIGTTALVLILFDGGLNTAPATLRSAIAPAAVLSTLGVLGTAAVMALAALALGVPWPVAAIFGAVVSSTDAAAVFSVLRGSGLRLSRRVATILEVESGTNDPMAFALTTAMTSVAIGEAELGWGLLVQVPLQLAIGLVGGLAMGLVGRFFLRRIRLPAGGLFPVMSVAVALTAFAVPTLLYGSGFLAVYVAGMVIGTARIPFRSGILRVQDALAWLSQVTMFLFLGMLVFPSRLVAVAVPGTILALVLALVARPLMVGLSLLPFRLHAKELGYLGWVGLRGAVPIILATYPILRGAGGGEQLFDLVFFVVVVNSLVPGATVRWLTPRLGLQSEGPPPPPASVEINAVGDLGAELLWFHIDAASAACGSRIVEIPFPPATSALLLLRGDRLTAPRGDTELGDGDYLCVLCPPEHRALVELLFGGAV